MMKQTENKLAAPEVLRAETLDGPVGGSTGAGSVGGDDRPADSLSFVPPKVIPVRKG